MNNLLDIRSLWKIYGQGSREEAIALRDITLTIREGEYVSIVGPSGAGKSTLLHLMGGLDVPTRGEVIFDGENITKLHSSRLALWRNKSVGFVFQFYHLIEELTVLENVALPALLLGRGRKISFKETLKLLQYLGIEGKKHCVPAQLSGGEKQKTAIARALVNEPKIIFCDEPTGNLDETSQETVVKLLESLHYDKKRTLVVVTHNHQLAQRALRTISLKGGAAAAA